MTVLVTGATGFVGSAVLRKLTADGQAVRALVRADSPRQNLVGADVGDIDIVVGDLGDAASLARAVKGCDVLYHVAADYRIWTRDPGAMRETNVGGTRNLMLAALEAGVGRIVYTSSVATLGTRPDGAPADEETPVGLGDMIGAYKQSKFLAEAEVSRLIAAEGLPCVIVNPSAPVGPRDIKPTPTGRIIVEAARGRMPAYVDTGLNMVHVDDVARGHLLARGRGEIGARYILGGDDLDLRDILAEIASICGRRPPKIRLPAAPLIPIAYAAQAWARLTNGPEPLVTVDGLRMTRKKMFYSSNKAKASLGYAPRPAAKGLADAVAWFKDNGYLG